MLKQHSKLVLGCLYFADMAVTIISFYVAYWIRSLYPLSWQREGLYPLHLYSWLLLVIVPASSFFLFYYRAYRSYRTISFLSEVATIGKAVISVGIIIGTIAFGLKSYYLSRTFVLTVAEVNFVLLVIERFCIRGFSWYIREHGYNYRNILIVGTDDTALDIARRIENYRHWGINVLGFISDNAHEMSDTIQGYRIIGKLPELEQIITREVVDEVIFTIPARRLSEFEDVFLMLEDNGINARMVANIFPNVIAKLGLEELESIPLLTFTTTPTNMLALVTKRVFDILSAIVLMIGALPFMVLTAFLIKATSPGPVFFKQKRSGLHGRVFTLYKFRSMAADAEDRKKELAGRNEMGGPVFKIADDPRVTKIGRFIRKTSIDELPQLWNVLKGDMSIVGPRPPLPAEVEQYKRWQRRRLSMRPGLTCLWQISGRNKINDFDEWVKLDLQYIDTWSLGLDMKIFLKTIPVVVFRKGAV